MPTLFILLMVVPFAFRYHTFQGAFWQLFPLTLSSSFVVL